LNFVLTNLRIFSIQESSKDDDDLKLEIISQEAQDNGCSSYTICIINKKKTRLFYDCCI